MNSEEAKRIADAIEVIAIQMTETRNLLERIHHRLSDGIPVYRVDES